MLSDDVVIYVPDDQIEEYKKVFEENNKNLNIQPSGKPAVLIQLKTIWIQRIWRLMQKREASQVIMEWIPDWDPESIDGVPVKAIGKRAFMEDPLLGM